MKAKKLVVASFLLLAVSILLAACGAPPSADEKPSDLATGATTLTVPPTPSAGSASSDLTRMDEQGAVEVAVQPTNLPTPGETLDFEVSMNTHSVDLDMDLATLSTLTTDTGKTVQASKWNAPRGGHHVSGTLKFPATINESPLLNGAKRLTLIIKDVDAPERTFTWDLGS